MSASLYSKIPSIENLLQRDDVRALVADIGHDVTRNALREATVNLRAQISAGNFSDASDASVTTDRFAEELVARAGRELEAANQATLVSVFNLTGTVLHTNLGRAVLPAQAIDALSAAAANPTTVEYDLHTGQRGDRDDHVEALLCELTGAEAATVVNNNAAAVMLCLNSLAAGSDVAVSRGELIEIGGAFRMPQIMEASGCQLVEVGTTNRTHLSDYAQAINPQTAALMIVHPSNYEIQGFTHKPGSNEIAALASEHGLPLINDLGSGTLVNLEDYGLPHEVTVREAIAAGADVVTFSGDKLLGGPQAGMIVGRAALIDRIKRNPMKRAMRVDKLILAAMVAVLRLYKNPARLTAQLPVMRLLTREVADINDCATRLCSQMQTSLTTHGSFEVVDCHSQIGSGALPGDALPSRAVAIRPAQNGGRGINHWSRALRALPCPVIGRVHDGMLVLDMRCLEDETAFTDQLPALLNLLDLTNHQQLPHLPDSETGARC